MKVPFSISPRMAVSPSLIAAASASPTMPALASIATWGERAGDVPEAPVSLSNPMEALISSMISIGSAGEPAAPHLIAHIDPAFETHSLMTNPSAPDPNKIRVSRTRPAIVAIGLVGLVAGGALGLYGMGHSRGQARRPHGRLRAIARSRADGPIHWQRVSWRPLTLASEPNVLDAIAFGRRQRHKDDDRLVQGKDDPPEPVGDLVRALPAGDAGARPVAGGASAPSISPSSR